MTTEQIENLEQSGAYIERMFHTLASYDSSSYKDFLEDFSNTTNFKNVSEYISEKVVDEYYNDGDLQQMLINFSLYGFIAEIRMPERSNFRFKEDGSFQSCSVHPGIMTCEYVFGKDIDELISKSIRIGNELRKEQEDKARLDLPKEEPTE